MFILFHLVITALATLKPQAAPGIAPGAAMPAAVAVQPTSVPEPMEAAEAGPMGMTEDIIQKVYLSIYLSIFSWFGGWLQHLSISLYLLVHSCSFSPLQFLTFSAQLILGLPLGLVPSTLPSNTSFKRLWCLLTWPKYLIFLSLTNPAEGITSPKDCQFLSLIAWSKL